MSFLSLLETLPTDPILGLAASFSEDKNPKKVNLGIGAYKTAEGTPFVLSCVKKAESLLLEEKGYKEYLPIDGYPEFNELSTSLIYGEHHQAFIYTAQTIGGTGALRIGAEFLAKSLNVKKVYLSTPTWVNHALLFSSVGIDVNYYPYYNSITHSLNFSDMCISISNMEKGSIILLHACCHNPTGIDLTKEQWEEVATLVQKRDLIAFFDFAYQGFAEGVVEDAYPITLFLNKGLKFLTANSYSKNFGLYGERIGALSIVTETKEEKKIVSTHIKKVIRSNYSSPAIHGAKIISKILSSSFLKNEWLHELKGMRTRIEEMRKNFIFLLQLKDREQDYQFLKKQRGMFSFSGLNEIQVDHLKKEFAIYIPSDGRINIAGLNQNNLEYVVNAIVTVQDS